MDTPKAPAIFVDLDGTLIWTWTPVITNAFMAQVFGAPICKPPTRRSGFRHLSRVPVGVQGGYCLASRRAYAVRFLRTLRTMSSLYMLTHAEPEYARAMNRELKLGFTQEEIFPIRSEFDRLRRQVKTHKPVLLIDDEGPGFRMRWRRRAPWYTPWVDPRAQNRHLEKCSALGIEPNSIFDIPFPTFDGRKNDPFCSARVRRQILRSIKIAICVGE